MNKVSIINMLPYPVHIITGARFDNSVRKYRGGVISVTFPSSGSVSTIESKQEDMDPIVCSDGITIPTFSTPRWERVDPLPEAPEGTMFIVPEVYVSACKELGLSTNHLLTIGPSVIGNNGITNTSHCVGLVRH